MEKERLTFGESGSLRFVLEWRDDYGTDGPVGRTWANLQLWLADTLVWGELEKSGNPEGIAWSLIEILEFFGNAWPYLIEEEQFPIAFARRFDEPKHLGELWGKSKLHLLHLPEGVADQDDELLRDFLAVHDFSEAFQGAQPPRLLCMRQGNQLLAATVERQWIFSFEAAMSTLESLCSAIVDRISNLSEQRAIAARDRWNYRNSMPVLSRLQIAVGRDESSLRRIWPTDIDSPAANDRLYELKAAARMIGQRLPDEDLKLVLQKINCLVGAKRLRLGTLEAEAQSVLRDHESADPALQGYFLASMLRKHIVRVFGKVDPEMLLSEWNVSIQEIAIQNSNLDAIAVWKGNHTPTIFVNSAGPRAQLPKGRRSTLAHEICHILVDRDGALPAVEVLGGTVPRDIEQRANAFAAEFLLPRIEAAAFIRKNMKFVYISSERRKVVENCLSSLSEIYGASHETTAWQILNSGCLEQNDEQVLKKYMKSIYEPFEFSLPE